MQPKKIKKNRLWSKVWKMTLRKQFIKQKYVATLKVDESTLMELS